MGAAGQAGDAGTSGLGGGTGGLAGGGGMAGHGGAGGGAAGQTGTAGTGGAPMNGGSSGAGGAAATGGASGTCGPSGCFTSLPVAASGMVFDTVRGRLYASVGGRATQYPNTIAVMDPVANAVVTTLAIGSDPDALALSDDASTLWVGIDGAYALRKVELDQSPPVVGPLHMLPPSSTSTSASASASVYAKSIAPIAGAPASVVAILSQSYAEKTVVLNDGVAGPITPYDANTPNFISEGPPGLAFGVGGAGSQDLFVFTLSTGAVTTSRFPGLFINTGRVLYLAGRLYGDSGQVVDVSDPSAPARVGAFAFTGTIAVRASNRLLMLSAGQLRILETDTFTQTASVPIPGELLGTSTDQTFGLVYAGGDAFAFAVLSLTTMQGHIVIGHATPVASPP
jgi:hypothetical protein